MSNPNRPSRPAFHDPRSTIHDPRWSVGRAYLLVTLGLLAIGLHRSINLLTLLAYALLTIGVLNLLAAKRSLRGLRAAPAHRGLAVRAHAVRHRSAGVQPRPTPALGSALRGQRARPPDDLVRLLAAGARARGAAAAPVQTFRQDVVLPRRGRYGWGALTVSSGYPFGLIQRCAELVPSEQVFVLPRVGWLHRGRFLRHLRSLTVQPPRVAVRNRPRSHPAAQAEFHGLRPTAAAIAHG